MYNLEHLWNEAAHEDVPLVSEQVVAPVVDSYRVLVDPVPRRGALAGEGMVGQHHPLTCPCRWRSGWKRCCPAPRSGWPCKQPGVRGGELGRIGEGGGKEGGVTM